MATFELQLVTPERVLWSGQAQAVSMRTEEGEITFLANHESYIAALDITVVKIEGGVAGSSGTSGTSGTSASSGTSGSDEEVVSGVRLAAAHGGFVHVDANKVTILAAAAEVGDEIDVARARRALEAAEGRLASGSSEESEGAGAPAGGAGGVSGAFLDPTSDEAAVARAKVRLEAAGAGVTV